MSNQTIVVVSSFPRSGTHFTIDFLRSAIPACRARKKRLKPNSYVYGDLDRKLQDEALFIERLNWILEQKSVLLIKTHKYANGEGFFRGDMDLFFPWLESQFPSAKIKVLSVLRDPVSTLKSYYKASRLGARMSPDGFLFGEGKAVEDIQKHRNGWSDFDQHEILHIDYNELLGNSNVCQDKIASFLELEKSKHFVLPKSIKVRWKSRLYGALCTDPPATTIMAKPGGEVMPALDADNIAKLEKIFAKEHNE